MRKKLDLISFIINEEQEGGYYAEAIGVGIFAEGDTLPALKKSITSGIDCYYENTANSLPSVHLEFAKSK